MKLSSLQRQQTSYERHVQAGLHLYGKTSQPHALYRWLARLHFERAVTLAPRQAATIGTFYQQHGELAVSTHFYKRCLRDPSNRRDAAAWTQLADAYAREADAVGHDSRRGQRCGQRAAATRAQADALAQPAPAPATRAHVTGPLPPPAALS